MMARQRILVCEFVSSSTIFSRWIGRNPAPHLWPPRSPDLNSLDFLWGALKAKVYRSGKMFRTAQELRASIDRAMNDLIQNKLLARVRTNLKARLRACLRNGGRHVQAGEQARMLRAIGVNGSVLRIPLRRNHRHQ